MRILLTGRNGQVGWELQRALAPLGEVVACDRGVLNLADPDRIVSAVRSVAPEVIVNAAAYTAVDKAESEPDVALAVNARAPGILAEEAKRLGALLVHYSTDYVFDGAKPEPYVEEDTTGPVNAYGRSKVAGEKAIQLVGGAHLIFRTSWIYATRGNNFFLTIRRLLKERNEVRVVSDQIGAPTSARALADTTAELFRRHGVAALREASGIYHATAAGHTSWYGFAEEIARLEKSPRGVRLAPVSSAEYDAPARRPKNSRLSNDKLHRRFKARLPDWRDCLRACHTELRSLEGSGAGV